MTEHEHLEPDVDADVEPADYPDPAELFGEPDQPDPDDQGDIGQAGYQQSIATEPDGEADR